LTTWFTCSIIKPVEELLKRVAVAIVAIASSIWAGSVPNGDLGGNRRDARDDSRPD
jgi:hypothetical protein